MARPVVASVTELVYAQLPERHRDIDAANGYHTLFFLNAHMRNLQAVYDLVRDRPEDGMPGWAIIFEPARAPAASLNYAAQYVGEVLTDNLPEWVKRERYARTRLRRGTKPWLERVIIEQMIIGDGEVPGLWIQERYDNNAWRFIVSIRRDQMPATDRPLTGQTNIIKDLITANKPMGTLFVLNIVDTGTYAELLATHVDYAEVLTDFDTYQELYDNPSHT